MEQVDWNPLLPPGSVIFTAAGLALLAVAAAWRSRLTVPRWVNFSALALRLLVLACTVLLVLRPEVVRQESRESPQRLVVLVDDTQSLRLKDSTKGLTRAEQGRGALEALLAGCAERRWQVQLFDAGLRLTPRQAQDSAFRATAPASPLGECLAAAAEHATDRPAGPPASAPAPASSPSAATILFSDGCVNRGRPLREAAALLRARAIPLFAVALGEAQPQPPDASLSDLIVRRAEDAGSVPEPLRAGQRLLAEARGQLLPGGSELTGPLADTVARLAIAGPLEKSAVEFAEVDALRHRLRPAPAWTPVRLTFTPPAPGFYRLRMALDPLAGERLLANNVAYGSLEILPPRKRVLYVCSHLGQDYRHLKALFADWDGPPVEVVPDFLRTQPAAQPTAPSPADEALARWLEEGTPAAARGGAVLWEEPDFARLSGRTQAKLRAALQSGEVGVIWIVAEPAEVLRRRLSGSPLEDAFLFRDLVPSAAASAPAAISSTAAAREHPATRWAFAAGAAQDPYRDFGPVAAWGEFTRPRDKTAVLLQAGAKPLLSVGLVGDGRVALLATGETWRWLSPLKPALGREAVPRLAGELLRRLTEWAAASTSRDEPPVRIYLAKDSWDLGEPLTARVAVRLAGLRDEARVQYDLVALKSGARPPAPVWTLFGSDVGAPATAPSSEAAPLGGATGMVRVFSGTLAAPADAGEWLLRARALNSAGQELGQDRVQFVVQGSALEELSIRPDREGLEAAVAAATAPGAPKGQVFSPDPPQVQTLLDALAPRMKPEVTTRVTRLPAVSTGSLLFLLLLALVVDVWLRRG